MATLPLDPHISALFARQVDGDGQANGDAEFRALYEAHSDGVHRFCLGILRDADDARDVVQSTMIKALESLRAGTRPHAQRAWLYTIARHEALDAIRRRRPHTTLDAVGEISAPELDPTTRMTVTALLSDLHRLPEQQRTAVVLRELQGLGYDEIATVLDTTSGNARQAVFKGRTTLFDYDRGRDLRCDEVRRVISDADGRSLRGGPLRAHLDECAVCAAFLESIRRRRSQLALLPVPPLALLDGVRDGTLGLALPGGAASATTTGTGVTVGAAGSAAGSAVAGMSVAGAAASSALIGGGMGLAKILAVTAMIATAGGGATIAVAGRDSSRAITSSAPAETQSDTSADPPAAASGPVATRPAARPVVAPDAGPNRGRQSNVGDDEPASDAERVAPRTSEEPGPAGRPRPGGETTAGTERPAPPVSRSPTRAPTSSNDPSGPGPGASVAVPVLVPAAAAPDGRPAPATAGVRPPVDAAPIPVPAPADAPAPVPSVPSAVPSPPEIPTSPGGSPASAPADRAPELGTGRADERSTPGDPR